MFNITSIYLKDFKSYAGEHEFDFPTKDGLYFLTGDNKSEPKLGSNGAGKSTLLDAICWCMYGRTLRGLKASDVVTWGQANCSVSLDLTVADQEFTITRTQSPNSFELEGRPIASLEKYIGVNDEAFVYSVILPQFGQSFFELKPAEKLTLFSQIMNLDFWLEKSQQAAEAAKQLELKVNRETNHIESTKELINIVAADIKVLKQNSLDFENNRKNELKVMDLGLIKIEDDLNKLSDNAEKLDRELTSRKKEYKDLREYYTKLSKKQGQIGAENTILKEAIRLTLEAIESLSTLKGQCPTCLQPIDFQHREFECRKMEAKLTRYEKDLAKISDEWNDIIKQLNKAEDENDYNEKQCQDARTELAVEVSKIDGLYKRKQDAEQEFQTKKAEVNPYSEMVTAKKTKLKALSDKLLEHQDKLAEFNAEHEATSYWVTGFKRIRLFIIEETLRSLELEVNNSLASLGLVDWQIEFDVERENKSGGVTKGFVVFIRCPSNPEPVRWESWSGGETQRLQLAGDFGLANLIMTQAGLSNTIEFYDEPSNHLSDEGLNDLAETLHQRAINEGKRIFLVDHRMPEFGDFEGVVSIIKNEKGSHIKHEKSPTPGG